MLKNPDIKVMPETTRTRILAGETPVVIKGTRKQSKAVPCLSGGGARVSKYNAKRMEYNGQTYDSKKEARFAETLDIAQRGGAVLYYLRQIPFRLPGGIRYLVDFLVVYTDGHIEFVDVKGMKTPMYRLKKKQTEALYPIKIKEV